MKNVFMLLLCSLLLVGFTTKDSLNENNPAIEYSDYCDGWEDGYCEGWKDVKGEYAICPITPICPIANPGQTRYKDGYNRGFKAGRAAAKK